MAIPPEHRPSSARDLAARAGTTADRIRRLGELGILQADRAGRFGDADVRRVMLVEALESEGISREEQARLIDSGHLSFEFLDRAGAHVFAAMSGVTFGQLSRRTGVPLETLAAIREATSSGPPGPSDRVREDELRVVGLVARQHGLGFRHDAIVRSLRAYGDGLRGIAEAEAEWWRSEVLEPLHAEGASTDEVTRRSAEISPDLSRDTDAALVALYHAQQMSVWMTNLVEGILAGLDAAGLYRRPRAFPAVAFVDLTGYTELTERRGDVDASGIIERFGQVVRAVLGQNGGRPVKWLGDGVMLHFPDRGRAVPIAVALMNAVSSAGLPPARVGIHCGPVVLRQGDLYGHTVNVAARVAAYARSGELLLTRSMADIVDRTRFGTRSIGPIELKGLREPLELFTVEAHPGS